MSTCAHSTRILTQIAWFINTIPKVDYRTFFDFKIGVGTDPHGSYLSRVLYSSLTDIRLHYNLIICHLLQRSARAVIRTVKLKCMLVVRSINLDSHPEIGCHRDLFSSDSIPTFYFSRVECLGLRIERIIVLENSIDFWSTINLIIFLILTGV